MSKTPLGTDEDALIQHIVNKLFNHNTWTDFINKIKTKIKQEIQIQTKALHKKLKSLQKELDQTKLNLKQLHNDLL